MFDRLLEQMGIQRTSRESVEEMKNSVAYGRTAYHGVLRHNDRVNSVQKLMHTYQKVDRMLQHKNQ